MMKTVREYSYWNDQSRQKLIELCKTCVNCKGQVNWDHIVKFFPDRTRQQCKSYYTNYLKQHYNIESKRYHTWSDQETELLLKVAQQENKNWEVIQSKYFKDLRAKQVQTKYFNARRYEKVSNSDLFVQKNMLLSNLSANNTQSEPDDRQTEENKLIETLNSILLQIQ